MAPSIRASSGGCGKPASAFFRYSALARARQCQWSPVRAPAPDVEGKPARVALQSPHGRGARAAARAATGDYVMVRRDEKTAWEPSGAVAPPWAFVPSWA